MAQNKEVAVPIVRYTRIDFTALRARLNKIATPTIIELYYNEEDLDERGCISPAQLEDWLDDLREHLIQRASLSNPLIAKNLADARKFNSWPKTVVDFLVASAEKDLSKPRPDDSVSVWLKPRIARVLHAEGIKTLENLKHYIEARGRGWFRPLPRLGPGKAATLERWLTANVQTLGPLVLPLEVRPADLIVVGPATQLVPLDKIGGVAHSLDGSEGINRNPKMCLISARNDLDAIKAYLYRVRNQEKTWRSYEKELNRFLLWCVCRRHIALSSVLMEDCEAYKDFLADPPIEWQGPRITRLSHRWRPFAGPLSPASQRYAVLVLRTFFDWLVQVRYLSGNPWATVGDPPVELKQTPIDIDKALPRDLWERLTREGGILDKVCGTVTPTREGCPIKATKSTEAETAQYRLARAAILLMGDSGVRRAEAAGATRRHLRPVQESKGELWELSILGKRNKWRSVYLPVRVIDALQLHWLDRGVQLNSKEDFSLISPVVIPQTPTARQKHLNSEDGLTLTQKGFSPDGLYQVVKTTLLKMADNKALDLDSHERQILRATAPHALRHTFATQAIAKELPVDVLQRLMGHVSQTTTSIYVRAERTRSIAEVRKLFR